MLMIVVMCMIREPIRVHGRRNKQSGAVTGGPSKPSLTEVGFFACAQASIHADSYAHAMCPRDVPMPMPESSSCS